MLHENPHLLPETPHPRCTVCWREITPKAPRNPKTQSRQSGKRSDRCMKCGAQPRNTLITAAERAATISNYTEVEDKTPTPPAAGAWESRGLCAQQNDIGSYLRRVATSDRTTGDALDTAKTQCAKCPVQRECLKLTTSMQDRAYLYAGVYTLLEHAAANALPALGYGQDEILKLINEGIHENAQNRLNSKRSNLAENTTEAVGLLTGLRGCFTVQVSTWRKALSYILTLPVGSITCFPSAGVRLLRATPGQWVTQDRNGFDWRGVETLISEGAKDTPAPKNGYTLEIDLRYTQPLETVPSD